MINILCIREIGSNTYLGDDRDLSNVVQSCEKTSMSPSEKVDSPVDKDGSAEKLIEKPLKVLVLNGFRDNWVFNRTQWYLIHMHNLT